MSNICCKCLHGDNCVMLAMNNGIEVMTCESFLTKDNVMNDIETLEKMRDQEMAKEILLSVTNGFNKWLKDMEEKYKLDDKYDIHDAAKQKDILSMAEEFNKWLEDMSERYSLDKDDIQAYIKLFLM